MNLDEEDRRGRREDLLQERRRQRIAHMLEESLGHQHQAAIMQVIHNNMLEITSTGRVTDDLIRMLEQQVKDRLRRPPDETTTTTRLRINDTMAHSRRQSQYSPEPDYLRLRNGATSAPPYPTSPLSPASSQQSRDLPVSAKGVVDEWSAVLRSQAEAQEQLEREQREQERLKKQRFREDLDMIKQAHDQERIRSKMEKEAQLMHIQAQEKQFKMEEEMRKKEMRDRMESYATVAKTDIEMKRSRVQQGSAYDRMMEERLVQQSQMALQAEYQREYMRKNQERTQAQHVYEDNQYQKQRQMELQRQQLEEDKRIQRQAELMYEKQEQERQQYLENIKRHQAKTATVAGILTRSQEDQARMDEQRALRIQQEREMREREQEANARYRRKMEVESQQALLKRQLEEKEEMKRQEILRDRELAERLLREAQQAAALEKEREEVRKSQMHNYRDSLIEQRFVNERKRLESLQMTEVERRLNSQTLKAYSDNDPSAVKPWFGNNSSPPRRSATRNAYFGMQHSPSEPTFMTSSVFSNAAARNIFS